MLLRHKMCFHNLGELTLEPYSLQSARFPYRNRTNLKTEHKQTRQEDEGCFASLCTAVLFVISPKHYQYFTTYNACNQSTMDQLQREEEQKEKSNTKNRR